MCRTFRRERNSRRRRHQNETRFLVASVVQGIEPAGDKWIVQRSDWQQPLTMMRVREPERGQQNEQVHLGDAEFDMLALWRKLPGEGRGDALLLERIGERF